MSSGPKYSSIDMVKVFFKELPVPGSTNSWECSCGSKRKQNIKNGYKNLLDHIHQAHPDWEDIMKQSTAGSQITAFIGNNKAFNIYCWIDWVISGSLPFTFVEREETS